MLAPCIAEAFDFRLTVEDTTYSKIFFEKVRLVLKPISKFLHNFADSYFFVSARAINLDVVNSSSFIFSWGGPRPSSRHDAATTAFLGSIWDLKGTAKNTY